MSADNCLKLTETKEGYHLTEEFIEGGLIKDYGVFKDLREAVKKIEQVEKDEPTEYGCRFHFNWGKTKGLN